MTKKKRIKGRPAAPALTAAVQRPSAMRRALTGQRAILLAVVALLAILPYANTLSNGFTLDDIPMIVHNPVIQDITNTGKIFTTNYWSRGQESAPAGVDPGLYRPFTVFTFAVDHAFWGLNPKGYHLVNVILHTAASLLFYIIAIDILAAPMAAFAAASIFAVHPIHTEAVTGIVGRAEVLAMLFFLLGFWFGRPQAMPESSPDNHSMNRRAMISASIAALFYLLGLFSKETAFTLPAVLLVYDWAHKKDFLTAGERTASRNLGISRYAALGVAILIYLSFRGLAVELSFQPWAGFPGVSAWERMWTGSRVLMEYLALLVFPRTLRADYWKPEVPIAGSPLEPLVLLSILLWAVLAMLAFRSWRHKTFPLLFSLAWFFITVLPASNLIVPVGFGKAERVLYIPSAGFCLFAGWLYTWLETKLNRKWILLPLLIPVLSVFAIRTYHRNEDWKDNFTLALATLKVSPTSPLFNNIAAVEHIDRGEPDNAIPLLKEAIRQRPDWAPSYHYLGVAYYGKGLLDQAIEQFKQSISLNPKDSTVHSNLGAAYAKKNQMDEAIQELNAALQINPHNPSARNNLGAAYYGKGLLDQAIEQYREALRLQPDYAAARNNLRRTLQRKSTQEATP